MTFFQNPQVIFLLFVLFITIIHTPLTNIPTPGEVGNFVQYYVYVCVCVGGGWKDVGVNSSDVG